MATADRDGQHRGGHVGVVVVDLAVVAVRVGGLTLLFLLVLRLVVGLVALVHLAGVIVVRRGCLVLRFRLESSSSSEDSVPLHRPSLARHASGPSHHAPNCCLLLAAARTGLALRQLRFAVRLVRALDKVVQIAPVSKRYGHFLRGVEVVRGSSVARWCANSGGG